MEYATLGRTGLKVSRIALGCMTYGSSKWKDWVLDEEESRTFFKQAIDLGINYFDTADMYSDGVGEEVTGRAVRDFARRDQIIIATKVYNPMGDGPNDRGLSRKHIMDAIDGSLRRLGTDYVDLYYIHRWDYETPIEETLSALDDIVRAGKVRYIGASAMWAWQFAKALYVSESRGWARFVAMQNHYNLIYREEEREMIPLCRREGVGVVPFSPLARGFLAGTRTRDRSGDTVRSRTDTFGHSQYYREDEFAVVDRVVEVAGRHGVKPTQIAISWMLSKPGITAPVVGASKLHHLPEAVAALDIKLLDDEIRYLEELYQPHPILGHM